MKDLTEVKAIAEQLLALSIELLRIFDTDEQERNALIESVKKTPAEKFFSSPAVNKRPKLRISKEKTKICENLNTVTAVLHFVNENAKTEL